MLKPHSPIELKIKAASLAAEALIIRRLERRLKRRRIIVQKGDGLREKSTSGLMGRYGAEKSLQFFSIKQHRRQDVRWEARATHLARTFLNGKAYSVCERPKSSTPPLKRAGEIAAKYAIGDKRDVAQAWEAWQQSARAHAGM